LDRLSISRGVSELVSRGVTVVERVLPPPELLLPPLLSDCGTALDAPDEPFDRLEDLVLEVELLVLEVELFELVEDDEELLAVPVDLDEIVEPALDLAAPDAPSDSLLAMRAS
jgi:hypothetical protein